MKIRLVLALLAIVVVSAGAWVATRSDREPETPTTVHPPTVPPPTVQPPSVQPPSDPQEPWPAQPNPQWPRGCLIENVGVHPQRPWLAAACTNAADESGAVLVIDAESGRLHSATALEGYVGWSENENLLRWHPDGQRLATNVDTNAIALLDRGRLVGKAYPDDSRDSGARYVWIDDRMFSDTGALFEIRDGDNRFDLESISPLDFEVIEWNATIGAVVGRVGQGIAAFDPIGRKVLYHEPMPDLPTNFRMHWSSDGRWCARRHYGQHPAPDEILIFGGDDGKKRWTIRPSGPRIDDMWWSRDGALLVQSRTHLDVVRSGRIERTIDVAPRAIETSYSIPEASGVAWSPTGDGIALLLDRQEIQLRDARTGAVLSTFAAPAPAIPNGLPPEYRNGNRPPHGFPGELMWIAPHRLVRVAPHFVAVWSIDGTKLAELVVPDRP